MMKSATTVLALASLYSADAFVLQAPKNVMQPLHAESYVDALSRAPSAPFAPAGRAPSAPFAPAARTSSAPFAPAAQAPPAAQNYAPAAQNYAPAAQNYAPAAQAPAPFATPSYNSPMTTRELFEEVTPVKVQGGTLRTCSFDTAVNRVSVLLKTTGRPLNANVDLWQGPDNSPQKMSVYLEDGEKRPFRAIVESPGASNAIAIRNTGQMEFPLTAGLVCDMSRNTEPFSSNGDSRIVQGGAVYTVPFPPSVQSVQIALKTDGRPLDARVELLQGPNNNKQVMEIYTEDGQERPFYAIIDTPGSGNVVRIVNTATVEFPLSASVESYIVDDSIVDEVAMTGGMQWS